MKKMRFLPEVLLVLSLVLPVQTALSQTDAPLPQGVKAVWDMDKAHREKTPTRERICVNGLWRWQPAEAALDKVPVGNWGFVKVPGHWNGQKIYAHPGWKEQKPENTGSAWYQREINVPQEWAGRKVSFYCEYLNSYAAVYLDGAKAGEMRFPWGEVDLTSLCHPGQRQILSVFIAAIPLSDVMASYGDSEGVKKAKGSVPRRGFCGDVYLIGAPAAARVTDVKIDTSTRKWEITFDTALHGLDLHSQYSLRARIMDGDKRVADLPGKLFKAADLKDGRVQFTSGWKPEKLWDIHTPQNMYHAKLALCGPDGKTIDEFIPIRFGFREFWIDGRDFYLNGSRIFLISVPTDAAQSDLSWANYGGAKENFTRLKIFGVNMVYTHNYGCTPGSHLGFEEMMNAADDCGMLFSLSLPHAGNYDFKTSDETKNGYPQHAEFYVRMAQNHPSVVFYSMNHNIGSYAFDMIHDLMGDKEWLPNGQLWAPHKLALRTEAIVKGFDQSRVVYHHGSGNVGSMDCVNFYPNFAPVQEVSDWFEHWAEKGVKPIFPDEYGAPIPWDFGMYRGYYKGKKDYGSAFVPWQCCIAEWDSQFFGDRVFNITKQEQEILRFEGRKLKQGDAYHRWDYPGRTFDSAIIDPFQDQVYVKYFSDNLRAFRTWGGSATNTWEYGICWQLKGKVDTEPKPLKVDWENLQRPGFSPDSVISSRGSWFDLAYERSDWVPTAAGEALIRNGQPLLAYIAGKPARFTSKDHNFIPGERVEKQLIIINNSRTTTSCDCQWTLNLPKVLTRKTNASVKTGDQARLPLSIDLPADLAPGKYTLDAVFKFDNGETQKDSFAIHVMPKARTPRPAAKIFLFDPAGQTGKTLRAMGIQFQPVEAAADPSSCDILVIGKAALTVNGPAPNIEQSVRAGKKVLVFEQTGEVLEQRLGFRIQEYGLRDVFKRIPDHPVLEGLDAENLRDWRGEATILPPRFKPDLKTIYGYMTKWCDIRVDHLWRCGCLGNVASVLIEKPTCGDFLPIVDGGFSLQYSPLLEYREGAGMVLFCQLDVTGRTENDPAAERIAGKIMDYVAAWKPAPRRKAVYVGDEAGKTYLESAGFPLAVYNGANLSADSALVVGPGGGKKLSANAAAIGAWIKAGGSILAIGLDGEEANSFLPFKITTKKAEHIAAFFEPLSANSPLAGIGPADVHNRDPRAMPLVTGGATIIGDGILAKAENATVVFGAITPGVGVWVSWTLLTVSV
jgi:hypothetical protein